MGQHILIIEANDIIRLGLKQILLEDSRVSQVYEAANVEEAKNQEVEHDLDLFVINPSLVRDMPVMLRGNFVVLTAIPCLEELKMVYEQGVRAYFSNHVSAELLRAVLQIPKGSFLIEPTLMSWFMQCILETPLAEDKMDLFTPKEQEIISLLQKGMDRHAIARQLCISEATLKTHIKNITRKK